MSMPKDVEAMEGGNGNGASEHESEKFLPKEELSFSEPRKFALTREELLKFEKDPFWIRMRIITFVMFWVVWFALLAGAITIVVLSPPCPPTRELKSYEVGMYHLDVKRFRGQAGYKTGMIAGLASEEGIAYLMSLHVPALILHNVINSEGLFNPDVFATENSTQELRLGVMTDTIKKFSTRNGGTTTNMEVYFHVPLPVLAEKYKATIANLIIDGSGSALAGAKGYVFEQPTDAELFAKVLVEKKPASGKNIDETKFASIGICFSAKFLHEDSIDDLLKLEKSYAFNGTTNEPLNVVHFVIYNVKVVTVTTSDGEQCDAKCLRVLTEKFASNRLDMDGKETQEYKDGIWRNFALNHETMTSSLKTRLGDAKMCTEQAQGECFFRFAAAFALPGGPVYYAGDELGQTENTHFFRWSQNAAVHFLYGSETPDTEAADLPMTNFGDNAETSVNVQGNSKGTELQMIRSITNLRWPPKRSVQPNAIQYGFSSLEEKRVMSFIVTRCTPQYVKYYVAMNFGDSVLIAEPEKSGNATIILPHHSSLVNANHNEGTVATDKNGVRLEPTSAVLLRLDNVVAENCDVG